jgi:hypothetical protein
VTVATVSAMVTIAQVFAGAGLAPSEAVRWGTRVGIDAPGVYAVSTATSTGDDEGLATAPISGPRVHELLAVRPELKVDGLRPMADELSERLASLWVPGEVVVYIGLAGTSLRKRIDQYYATHLGARGPHAGGWPLKTLDLLGDLRVFVARCSEPSEAEQRMLAEFAQRVPVQVARHLRDPLRVMPFANLEYPKGNRKAHGISGAREPRAGGPTGAPPQQNASAPVFDTPVFTSVGPHNPAGHGDGHCERSHSNPVSVEGHLSK